MRLRLALLTLLASVSLTVAAGGTAPAASTPASTSTSTASIGGVAVALPILPGYADPSATPLVMMNLISHALPPTNRLLSVMLQDEFLARLRAHDPDTSHVRYLAVQTFPQIEWSGISPEGFAQVKSMLRAQNARMLEEIAPQLAEAETKMSKELGDATGDHSVSLRSGASTSLGVFDEQADSIGLAALQTLSVTVRDHPTEKRQAMAMGAVRLHGKLLMVSAYSSYDSQADIDWVKAQVHDWVERLAALNP